MNVHLGERQSQCPFTPQALLQGLWVEASLPHLRDGKGDVTNPGPHRLGLEAVGMSLAFNRSLVRFGVHVLLAFCLHRRVQNHSNQFRQNIQALFLHLLQQFSR